MQTLYVLLSLGSNLGDRFAYLQAATTALTHLQNSTVLASSYVYENPPWGIEGTPLYLNSAVRLSIDIPTINYSINSLLTQLLLDCQTIEANFHRQRDINNQYAARTLDIDLLYAELSSDYHYASTTLNTVQLNTRQLTIPHTHFSKRAFALKTALDIWYSQTSREYFLKWYHQPDIQSEQQKLIKQPYTILI